MKHAFVSPILAVIAVTVAVPMVTQAAVNATYRSLGQGSAGVTQVDYDGNFTQRSVASALFDLQQFRLQRRFGTPQGDTTHPAAASASAGAQSTSATPPCETPASASSSSVASALDFYQDLTTFQRSELMKQIRIGGCPQTGISPAYKALCEQMLAKYGEQKALQVGPRNSHQTQADFLQSGGAIGE